MATSSNLGAQRLTGTEVPVGSERLATSTLPPDEHVQPVRKDTVVQHTEHHDTTPAPAPAPAPVNVAVPEQRRDQVRWGPVWAGLIVALPTFLLLELAFFALGWLTPGANNAGAGTPVMTGLIGLFAFFLGGLTAGATTMWRGIRSGLLHGILVWALGVVAFLFVTLFGGGALFGSLADVLTQTTALQRTNVPDVNVAQAVQTARDAAGWAVLGLGLSWAAATLGGILGAKMWPGKEDTQPDVVTAH